MTSLAADAFANEGIRAGEFRRDLFLAEIVVQVGAMASNAATHQHPITLRRGDLAALHHAEPLEHL